jgi:mRNA interferase HigB
MNIYNKGSIIEFYKKHQKAKVPLEVWFEEVGSKKWKSPNDLKLEYGGSASILRNSRAVFDIKGNEYRIVAALNYDNGWLYIKFIGTHTEYDRIDANMIDIFKSKKK